MATTDSKRRIAVLGGGLSSLTAVFELTSIPRWQERYAITVYQMGWRLGGKGASGRNQAVADRIEEHGLHVFFGFYENAIGIMRRCYQELGRHPDAPLAGWQDAFKRRDLIVMEEYLHGKWHHWPLPFPPNDDRPGDWCEPFPDGGISSSGHSELPSAFAYFQMALELTCDFFDRWWWRRTAQRVGDRSDAIAELMQSVGVVQAGLHSGLMRAESLLGAARGLIATGLNALEVQPLRELDVAGLHAARAVAKGLPDDARDHSPAQHQQLWALLSRFRRWLASELAAEIESNFESYQLFVLLDLTTTGLIGMIEDRLLIPPAHWHDIDGEDFRGWLKRHGGSDIMLASAPPRTLYSAAFATGTTGAAGTTLHNCLRMIFTYKGSVLWEMQASMGDTIFAPLYTVLKRRGVEFEFFRRVDDVQLGPKDAAGQRKVERIVIGRQATLTKDCTQYDPLFDVLGLPCWPSEPRYAQLEQGAELERLEREYPGEYNLENWWTKWPDPQQPDTLLVGRDFDHCILGIGIGAFPYICKQLIADADNPRFGTMVQQVQTTMTQAAQLWFRPGLAGLGWPMLKPVVIPYAEPYDTWADMSHLLARERWQELGQPVGNIAYLCSRLIEGPDFQPPPRDQHDYPFGQLERARRNLREWLRTQVRQVWPYAARTDDPDALNWDWLVDPQDREGLARLDAQFCIADWNPSDRYVLSTAGSTQARLLPDQSGYANLTLTGDWTLNAISSGCAEAATIAGMLAARAICGYPQRIVGEWLDELRADARALPEAPVAEPPGYPFGPDPKRAVPYIPRPGDLLSLPPLAATGTSMTCFVLQADRGALSRMCDSYLNLGPDCYEPVLPLAVFVAVHIDKAHPVGRRDLGWMAERDYGIWIPLKVGRRVGGRFVIDRFCWYQPYLWIDNSAAVADGREVYGLEKSLGVLSGPTQPSQPAKFSVDTIVSVMEREVPAAIGPLVRVGARDRDRFGAHELPWNGAEQAARELRTALQQVVHESDWERDFDLLEELLSGEQLMAGLKQTPSVAGGGGASYQAIVETPSQSTSPVSAGLIDGTYDVDIKFWPSHDVVALLGLQATALQDGWQRAPSLLNVRFEFDFAMGPGREIYRLA